jgi:hypothetical protein
MACETIFENAGFLLTLYSITNMVKIPLRGIALLEIEATTSNFEVVQIEQILLNNYWK